MDTAHLLVVVAARRLTDEEPERGDEDDDAERCRSDARARPCAAFAAAERVRGTLDVDGADMAREREKNLSGTSVFATHQNGRSQKATTLYSTSRAHAQVGAGSCTSLLRTPHLLRGGGGSHPVVSYILGNNGC